MKPLTTEERAVVQRMVNEAGELSGHPAPYTVKAVYADATDASIKIAAFVCGDGSRLRTGRFKLVYGTK